MVQVLWLKHYIFTWFFWGRILFFVHLKYRHVSIVYWCSFMSSSKLERLKDDARFLDTSYVFTIRHSVDYELCWIYSSYSADFLRRTWLVHVDKCRQMVICVALNDAHVLFTSTLSDICHICMSRLSSCWYCDGSPLCLFLKWCSSCHCCFGFIHWCTDVTTVTRSYPWRDYFEYVKT